MTVYTVRKNRPNTDREFQAYVDLLQEIGIDISNVPRTPEPGTDNRWLYVWKHRQYAERFARELSQRLRDRSFAVHELDVPDDESLAAERGPLAPLTILSIPTGEGTEFHLEPASQERIAAHFPNARLVARIDFPTRDRAEPEQQNGAVWNRVILHLTGIPGDAIMQLGGVRIINTNGDVLYQRLPAAAQHR